MLKINIDVFCVRVLSPAWVDAVWECEFTEAQSFDSAIEEEIGDDVNVFKNVYQQLLPFSSDDENTQVM